MPQVTVRTRTGGDDGTLQLSDATFGIEPNVGVMHQVVTAQLAARRAGSHSTLTRAEVRGGGAKPWRQKGTGRARQGSIRAPQWRGGGVAFGPKPRDYSQRTPKKMVRLALRSALSDRAAEEKVLVVDAWDFEAPRTKDAVALLDALGVDGRALVVVGPDAEATWKSFRNLPTVHVISPGELNAYDVLVSDVVIFSRDTLPADEAPRKRRAADAAAASTAADLVKEAKAAKAQKTAAERVATAVAEAPAEDVPADDGSAAQNADPADSYDSDDVEGESDMPSDLPNRPPRSGDDERTVIDPKDRVKSAADKPDPRFEAARQKADKEADLRAKQAKAQARSTGDDVDDVDEAAPAEPPAEKASPFSFNNSVKPKDD